MIILMVLIALGMWQQESSAEMKATVELINKRLLLDPIKVDDIDKGGDWRYYPVQLQGTFDNEHQILITNRMYKNRRGFQVLTPFRPSNSSKEILVNRGWLAGDPTERVPDLGTIPDGVTISGVLFRPVQLVMGSSFDEKNVTWPLIIKSPDIDKIGKVLNNPMYPYIVLLSPSSQYGFVREWLWLANAIEASRHKIYARQWFVLAFTVLLAFIFMNIHRAE